MFAFIRGKLVETTPLYVVVDTGNIGYMVAVPPNLFPELPPTGEEVFLHTLFVVRENAQTLYGFLTAEDRKLFETLTTVNGVGPKLALSIIGHLSTDQLQQIVHEEDIDKICRVPGVGKKTAARVMMELKDKISLPTSNQAPSCERSRDAMSALINLGYKQNAAQKAVQKTLEEHPDNIELAMFITHALKHIVKN